ncbi:MAG TPA: phage tail protein [Solirubrobacteraceae bacterium]|nr:phage tail protein [Solirubrobacteraceae bacterium]
MPTTPRLALPYPEDADTADVPRDLEALAVRVEALTAWIRQTDFAAGVGVLAPGDLKLSAVAAAPTGWLLCDGASKLRADFTDLFDAIGGAASPWGLPDGTHFNVPDFRGRVPLGVGTGSGLTARAMAATAGAETHALTKLQLAGHVHDQFIPGLSVLLSVGISNFAPGAGAGAGMPASGSFTSAQSGSIQGGAADGVNGAAHNNVQPSLACNVFIKT